MQIEDLSQQAQVAAAEKFKEPPIIAATEAGGSTTVRFNFLKNQILDRMKKKKTTQYCCVAGRSSNSRRIRRRGG